MTKHIHDDESISRSAISAEAAAHGVKDAQMLKCKGCGRITVRILTAHGWVALFDEQSSSGEDILLA